MKKLLLIALLGFNMAQAQSPVNATYVRVRDSLTSYTNNTDLVLKGRGPGKIKLNENAYNITIASDSSLVAVIQRYGISGSGTANRVAYWNGSSSLTSNSAFTYNGSLDVDDIDIDGNTISATGSTSGTGSLILQGSSSGSYRVRTRGSTDNGLTFYTTTGSTAILGVTSTGGSTQIVGSFGTGTGDVTWDNNHTFTGSLLTTQTTNQLVLGTTHQATINYPEASAAGDITITTPVVTSTLYGTGTGTITSSQMATSLSDETGSGALVFGTSPTLVTPRFGTGGYIADSNGNELVEFPATVTSPVNHVKISNSATTVSPLIEAVGGDTDVSLLLQGKGANGVRIIRSGTTSSSDVMIRASQTAVPTSAQTAPFIWGMTSGYGGQTGDLIIGARLGSGANRQVRFYADNGGTIYNIMSLHPANGMVMGAKLRLMNYTVATLPTGATGDLAYVTDALAPTAGTTVVGGGAVVIPVFFNGTNWVSMY